MSSGALLEWRSDRAARLDRLRALSGPELPLLTESLVLRLAAEFQGFARDLHDETVQAVLAAMTSTDTARRAVRSGTSSSGRCCRPATGSPTTTRTSCGGSGRPGGS